VIYQTFWNDFTYYRFAGLGEKNDFLEQSQSNILFSESSEYPQSDGPVTYIQSHNGQRIVESFEPQIAGAMAALIP